MVLQRFRKGCYQCAADHLWRRERLVRLVGANDSGSLASSLSSSIRSGLSFLFLLLFNDWKKTALSQRCLPSVDIFGFKIVQCCVLNASSIEGSCCQDVVAPKCLAFGDGAHLCFLWKS